MIRTAEDHGSTIALEERNRRQQMGKEACWATGRALYDQMHRLASSLGPEVLSHTVLYLSQGLQSLSDGNPPMVLASRQQRVTLDLQGSRAGESRILRNPNVDSRGNRGSRRRIRGALERTQRKRGKRDSGDTISG